MSFPTFLMSFAASHSGCQASTEIGATPAHTGKVHTQVVLCLCFVLTERTRQASCCTSGQRELNFALTWIAFVFGSKTWLEKWQLSHGFAVDGAYFLGFSTVLSEKQVVLLPIELFENWFSVSSVQERLVLLASQLLPSTLIGSNNVQVARLVMGCHECIRACLGMFLCTFFPTQLETFIRRRKVVTWSRPRTKILPAASRGQWLTQHDFSWLLVHLEF